MQAPTNFTQVIGKKRYSTKTATLIADNVYWDGYNMEKSGTNTFLYKTEKGAFFTVYLTQWQGDSDHITPVTENDAYDLCETSLSEHHVPLGEAFPSIVIEDA